MTCDTADVLGLAVSMIASLAATQGLKWLLGAEEARTGGLIQTDVWDLSWHVFDLKRSTDCPCCVQRQFPYLEVGAASHATSLCGRNAIQITPTQPAALNLAEVADRLRPLGEVMVNPFLLKFRVGEHGITLFPDGRAVIQGTTEESVARGLYARYVGA